MTSTETDRPASGNPPPSGWSRRCTASVPVAMSAWTGPFPDLLGGDRVTTIAPSLRQVTLPTPGLLVGGAAAWLGVIAASQGMGSMPGTIGLALGAFTLVWVLMMTAMMLPTIAPFAALYTRTLTDHRAGRIVEVACGYLLVWASPRCRIMPSRGSGKLAGQRPAADSVLAVATFTTCGIHQLTPIKDRCLARCRTPLGFIIRYGRYRGRLRDLWVGMSHGLFCLACCWVLMAVLVAIGLMNLVAMVVLAAVVLAEKTSAWGPHLSRVRRLGAGRGGRVSSLPGTRLRPALMSGERMGHTP